MSKNENQEIISESIEQRFGYKETEADFLTKFETQRKKQWDSILKMNFPAVRKLAYKNDAFIRIYKNYFVKAQEVAKSSLPEEKRREIIHVQEKELKQLLLTINDSYVPDDDLNEKDELTFLRADQSQLKFQLTQKDEIIRSLIEQLNNKKNEERQDTNNHEDDYVINKSKFNTNSEFYKLTNITDQSLFFENNNFDSKLTPKRNSADNETKSNVLPSAPSIYTETNLKTPIRSEFMDKAYENKQSTVNLKNSASEKIKGKLSTNIPLLSGQSQTNKDTLDLIKFVAELAGSNRTKRLDSNTKKFTGSISEDVDDWLFNIEREEDKLNAKKGHYANNCYANLSKINSLQINENYEDKIYVVYLDERGPKNICSVKGLVDNKPLKIGLDCGATNSVMNHMTAIRNEIEILRSDLKISTANGRVSHISGITKPLEVNIGGNKCFMQFLVFDHDVLLGLDWFNKTECGFFPSQGILKFKNDVHEQEEIEITSNETFDIFQTDV
ncbi:unnamed protein product [Brachionus calyciflorus]|uniref:Peptidase A2 domain-containing protein n=1 Tax=Brachionus calyciflorus TaxID=104777 RepID=A0A814NNH8_9BILA|nr:unnamed protein product [Brachionus calyciflorus]